MYLNKQYKKFIIIIQIILLLFLLIVKLNKLNASDSQIYTWGSNFYGQLGTGGISSATSVPKGIYTSGVLNGKIIVKVSSSNSHTLALDCNGKVYAWGKNQYGQLGDGTITSSNLPIKVNTSGLLNETVVAKVSAGVIT
jgi:alpha-tubulin suppressor-like RCC1 family protein